MKTLTIWENRDGSYSAEIREGSKVIAVGIDLEGYRKLIKWCVKHEIGHMEWEGRYVIDKSKWISRTNGTA